MLDHRILGLVFFFSSRRRHTRSLCDWSSDVCSSDLPTRQDCLFQSVRHGRQRSAKTHAHRSEERRVGKECRYRWSAYHYKKNRCERIEYLKRVIEDCGISTLFASQRLSSNKQVNSHS